MDILIGVLEIILCLEFLVYWVVLIRGMFIPYFRSTYIIIFIMQIVSIIIGRIIDTKLISNNMSSDQIQPVFIYIFFIVGIPLIAWGTYETIKGVKHHIKLSKEIEENK